MPNHFLPSCPSLSHLKKQAKKHLTELKNNNPHAKLSDAQFELAKKYGFRSWTAMKHSILEVGSKNEIHAKVWNSLDSETESSFESVKKEIEKSFVFYRIDEDNAFTDTYSYFSNLYGKMKPHDSMIVDDAIAFINDCIIKMGDFSNFCVENIEAEDFDVEELSGDFEEKECSLIEKYKFSGYTEEEAYDDIYYTRKCYYYGNISIYGSLKIRKDSKTTNFYDINYDDFSIHQEPDEDYGR